MRAPGLISWQMGAAVVGGVPALVLVSLGQISALAGSAAVLVWIASATLGLIMAFSFAQLPRCFPGVTGGLGVLASYTHERDRPWLATATRWSYWLGWSPGLAVYSAVLANYALVFIDPKASPATAWLLSIVIIVVTTAINCRGISAGAALQVALSITVLLLLVLLFGGATARFSMARLLPVAPPAGWSSWQGVAAVAGALFLAGWTCYGAELAICLAAEYRRGTRDALRCLSVVALVTFVVYAVVPALITGVIGSRGVEDDPARALLRLVPAPLAWIGPLLALGTVMAALVLSVNMIVMTSSRVLLQMGRDEASFAFLAKTKNGVPANALIFDGAANCLLLTACFVSSGGKSADVPVALLCAANVAYFVTIILALLGIVAIGPRMPDGRRPLCCSRLVVGLLILINTLLLTCAGFAWGWRNISIGWSVFLAITATAIVLKKRGASSSARIEPDFQANSALPEQTPGS